MKCKRFPIVLMILMAALLFVLPAEAKSRKAPVMTINSVATGNAVYNPYYGSKLKIITDFSVKNVRKNDKYRVSVTVTLKDGKTIFKKNKTFKGKKILSEKGKIRYSFKWNGRASKGNPAGLANNTVAPVGDYIVTATLKCVRASGATKPKKTAASSEFKVDNTVIEYTPVSGKVIPKFTGTAEIDYAAELMLKEAGVKTDMPEELRVRLIYNYITIHFRHLQETGNIKPVFNLTALASEIEAYKKETRKLVNAGLAKYTNKWSGELNHFIKQAGTCNNNAAAFVILCNHVGIKCKRVHGKVYNGSATMNHYWNSAVVNGVTLYYDPDVEIHHYKGNGVSSFSQYAKTLEQCKKSHIFDKEA